MSLRQRIVQCQGLLRESRTAEGRFRAVMARVNTRDADVAQALELLRGQISAVRGAVDELSIGLQEEQGARR